MGCPKLLLPWGETTVLGQVVATAQAAVSPGCVVVIEGAVPLPRFRNVTHTHADDWAKGMLATVQAGVRALPAGCTAWMLALADLPLVAPDTFRAVAARHNPARPRILIPTFAGRRGHPTLFPAGLTPELLALDAQTESLRTLLERHAGLVDEIPVADPAIRADVDTPADYARAVQYWAGRTGSMI